MIEETLVLIKPDAFKRHLTGEIIAKFERVGLDIKKMKLIEPDKELIEKHYPDDETWLKLIGEKTISTYKKYRKSLIDDLGTENALEIGKIIRKWLLEYISSGPVVAIVISGNHAIEIVRKLIGNTVPIFADLGTVRGDYSVDSPDLANREKRSLFNLVHASGNSQEAEKEITLWFK